jgi:hypothetical protein
MSISGIEKDDEAKWAREFIAQNKSGEDGTQSNSSTDEKGWTEKANVLLIMWMVRTHKSLRNRGKHLWLMKLINTIVTLFYIICFTIAGSLSFWNVVSTFLGTTGGQVYVVNLIVGVFAITSSVCAGILSYLNLSARITEEKYAFVKFSKLLRDIETVIYLEIDQRPSAKEFLQRISDKHLKYEASTPFSPDKYYFVFNP